MGHSASWRWRYNNNEIARGLTCHAEMAADELHFPAPGGQSAGSTRLDRFHAPDLFDRTDQRDPLPRDAGLATPRSPLGPDHIHGRGLIRQVGHHAVGGIAVAADQPERALAGAAPSLFDRVGYQPIMGGVERDDA